MYSSGRSARVVLPTSDGVLDESDEEEEEEAVDGEDTDILADFPDETQASSSNPYYHVVIIIRSEQELELIHSRMASLDSLRLSRFAPWLKKLCLRQNYITRLDPDIFGLLTKLEDLDLYDNKIKTVGSGIDNLANLSFVSLYYLTIDC